MGGQKQEKSKERVRRKQGEASKKKRESTEKELKRTHCSHLVWKAFHRIGLDLDCDGSPIVTPYDIVHDEDVELVQAYGMCLDEIRQ